MSFTIHVGTNDKGAVVLKLSGKLSAGDPVLQLRESIQTQLGRGVRQIVMSAITSVDSSALGELVASYTAMRSNRGMLELVGLNAAPNSLVQKSGLEPVLSGSSAAPPRRRKTLYRNIGIALTVVPAAAFYWVLTR